MAKALPAGTPGLTINGVAGGSTITLNDGAGHFGYFSGSTATLGLSNVTVTGGSEAGTIGGAINTTGNLTINASGTVAFIGNSTNNNSGGAAGGGAIRVGGALTIAGGSANLVFNNNSATGVANPSGGAILSTGATTITANSVTVSDNTATNGGGGINAGSVNITVADTLTITGNTANTSISARGGGIQAGAVTLTGPNIIVSNNTSRTSAGGISSQSLLINGNLTANNNIGTGPAGAAGGAIAAYNGTLTVTGGVSMDGNAQQTSNGGGALYSSGNMSLAASGGNVSLTNNSGASSGGAILSGGTVTVGNSAAAVTMTGNSSTAFGGAIRSTGSIIITGSSVNLSNNTGLTNAGALYSNNAVTVNGPLVASNNLSALGSGGGIYSLAGDVTTNADVSMSGNVAGGGNGGAIYVNNGNAVISTTSGNVSLTNNTASLDGGAISATGSGNVTVGNAAATVTLSGNKAGFDATGAPVNAISRGGAIFAAGATMISGLANTISNNQATLDGGGIYSVGAFTLNAGGPTALNGNIAGGNGGAIWGGSNVALNATGGDITFSGNLHNGTQANAIYLNNIGGATTTTFNAAAGRTITFFDPVQSNAANGLVSVIKTGAGTVAFDGSLHAAAADEWSQVYGATQVQAGRFVVNNNAVYGVLAADVGQAAPSSFVVSPGATLAGGVAGTVRADAFTLGGTLDIAGTAAGTVGNLFTVAGNNISFSAGSRVLFNTFLGTDGSPSDRLIISGGTATGNSLLLITNVGGPGALTTGNGILLVDTINGGTTAPGAFALARPVAEGPYDYTLFRSSVDASNAQAWYLRSTINCTLVSTDPICAVPGVGPTPPDFRPETSLYAAIPSMALIYGRTLLDTLHERVGDEEDLRNQPRQNGVAPGAWARVIGQHGNNQGDPLGIFGSGPKFDYDIGAFQGGQDLLRREGADSKPRPRPGFIPPSVCLPAT
ncbi:MAG: hypothetical protein WDN50_04330 [Bradyrhizobium sp.]